ncbi:MAG: T9SS type A sorting domain-containing protein [Ignavibacteria bacterium]|nr:T9SS type A sorting domain-containing protein [Ignavibacteria bacterium]
MATASGTDSFYTDNSITTAGSGPSYAQYRIRARDIEGYNSDYSSPVQIRYGEGIEKRGSNGSDIPNEFHLSQNYPNPFNPSTKIKFGIPYSSFASLKVYDVLGQIVAALFNNTLDAGNYEIELNSIQSELKSGIYYYELRSNDFHEVKKFMLLK